MCIKGKFNVLMFQLIWNFKVAGGDLEIVDEGDEKAECEDEKAECADGMEAAKESGMEVDEWGGGHGGVHGPRSARSSEGQGNESTGGVIKEKMQ
jgi:hypothetical protein